MSTTAGPASARAEGLSRAGEQARQGEPRAMRADAQRNRQRLLAAASAAFAEHGADDACLEEIARRAGVGIGTLYRHFPNRQALLEAVYRDQVEALSARADELLTAAEPGAALTAWLRALVAFSAAKSRLTEAMLAGLGKDSELLSSCGASIRDRAEALLARAQQAGVVRADAEAQDVIRLVHAVNIAAQRAPVDPGQTERLLGLVLDGLRPQPPAAG
ncbi:MAG: TetR/AcrR family transcriptional regulator [Streptosporangiaceae bacterium]